MIDQQVALGYESSSAFNDAFTKIMGNPPKKTQTKILHANFISTPIGRMISVTDATHVYLLEFVDRRGLEKEIENMRKKHQARILVGETNVHQQLAKELTLYFEKKLTQFSVPLSLHGTPFQMKVWDLLTRIPSGETSSYRELAMMLGDPHLVRAVGNANGANQLAIIIPCHRVIQTSGELGGYGGGVERKKYLLQLEQRI